MGSSNPFQRILKTSSILFLFFVLSLPGISQNIFLQETSGLYTFGQFAQVQDFDEPAIGLSYSFNGTTSAGISYGASSLNGSNYHSVSLFVNHLVKEQEEGDLFNIEVAPAFERKYHSISEQNLSLFSFAAGISRDFSQDTSMNLIPRASLSYLVSPSVGVTNYLSSKLDIGMGFNLSNNVKLIVNPGLNLRLDNGLINGTLTSGLLIH